MSRIRVVAIWSVDREVVLPLPRGVKTTRSNPRLWDGVIKANHDAVYAPDYPHIEAAYKAAGREVYRPDGVVQDQAEKPTGEPVESANVIIEEDVQETPWRELPWPLMRSKATGFTDEPVKNKDMAIEILERAEDEGKL